MLLSPRSQALWCEEGKASWLPAECRSTRCVFNQEQGWESLLGLDVELIVSVTPSVEGEEDREREEGGDMEGNVACMSAVKRSSRVIPLRFMWSEWKEQRRKVMGREDAGGAAG